MSPKKKIILSITVLVVLLAGFVFVTFQKIYAPTKGEKIATYADPAKALLVIDVQEDYTGTRGKQPVPYTNGEGPIRIINELIDRAPKAGVQVVYIRQIFDNNMLTRTFIGRSVEGTPGAELDSRVKVINGNVFTKKISDSFSNTLLETFLIKNRVNELYLAGLDAAYCVHKTA